MLVVSINRVFQDGELGRQIFGIGIEPCVQVLRAYGNDTTVVSRSQHLWRWIAGDHRKRIETEFVPFGFGIPIQGLRPRVPERSGELWT